jgi:hypothetical protein
MHVKKKVLNLFIDPDSKWVIILDSGLRNESGQTISGILVDIFHAFPGYKLQLGRGCEAAIRDIEHKLSDVASFEIEKV